MGNTRWRLESSASSRVVDAPSRRAGSAFDAPVGPTVDRIADRAAAWQRSPRWSPVVVAAVGFAVLAVGLIVVGELVTRGPLLGGLRSWDQQVSEWFSTRRTSGWDAFSSFGSHVAETVPIIVGALIVEAVLIWRRRWRDLLVVLVGLSVEITVFLTVNEIVRRPRPPVHRLGIEPATFSFPSGHIAATVVLYGSMALLISLTYRRRLITAALWTVVALFALLVGFARVYRGMHHVSDVAAGAVMGVGCLYVAAIAARSSALAASRWDRRAPGGQGDDDGEHRPTPSRGPIHRAVGSMSPTATSSGQPDEPAPAVVGGKR